MPALPVQSFASMVQLTVAGIQGRASALINFAVGSTLRAITEGFAGLFLWFQAMVLAVLAASRLSTASGTDVDTFCADFMPILAGSQTAALPNGTPRLGAQAASGLVTFSRLTAGPSSVFIPVGAQVRSNDGAQIFTVTADTMSTAFSVAGNGYILQPNIGSVDVPIVDNVPGAAGNIAAGAISIISSTINGIDEVINNAAFNNGTDQESDAALKQRFAAYILGLSRGDLYGLQAAIEGVLPNIQFTVTEGYNYDGSYRPGYFFIVVDDGSGAPSPTVVQAVANAANAVRPLGIQYATFSATIVQAAVSLTITTAPNFDHNTLCGLVADNIATNIDELGLGVDLLYSQIAGWAYAVPGVRQVHSVFLNGQQGDAADLPTWFMSQDGTTQIYTATVKAQTVTVI